MCVRKCQCKSAVCSTVCQADWPGSRAVSVQLSDFFGWGGDLLTFWHDWYLEGFPDDFCEDNLFSASAPVRYPMEDLVSNADGYNIGQAVRDGSDVEAEVNRIFVDGGHTTRIQSFVAGRFDGDREKIVSVTKSLMKSEVSRRGMNALCRQDEECEDAFHFAPTPFDDINEVADERLDSLAACHADKMMALAGSN